MATRTIYINPGDLIELRIITDPELSRNAREWQYQTRPEKILLQYRGYNRMSCADPAVRLDYGLFTTPTAAHAATKDKE